MVWKFTVGRNEAAPSDLCCSFCGKVQDATRRLIAGPNVFICHECVEVCTEIIADEKARATAASTPGLPPLVITEDPSGAIVPCALCQMPTIPFERVPISGRGLLCLGCIGEIEAAVAERRLGGQGEPET